MSLFSPFCPFFPRCALKAAKPSEALYALNELQILHEDVPDGDDMADGACEDEEVEHGVHIASAVEGIEQCAGDVAHALGDDPHHGSGADAVE